MFQRKISDMFASQGPSPRRSQPDLPPNTNNRKAGGSQVSASNEDKQGIGSNGKNPSSRKRHQGSGHATAVSPLNTRNTPSAASFLSIPSTPTSEATSSQKEAPKNPKRADENVPETPQPNRHRGTPRPPSGRTPTKPIELPPGTSPHTPIELSSGDDSSDSDCMLQSVQPTPTKKRKRNTASTPKATPAKRAKAKEAAPKPPTRAAVKQKPASKQKQSVQKPAAKKPAAQTPVVQTPDTQKSAAKKPAAQTPATQKQTAQKARAASLPPRPNAPTGSSSPATANTTGPLLKNRFAIKAKFLIGTELQASSAQVTPKKDDPDCFIEKVQPSPAPKRSLPNKAKKPPPKKRRVGNSNASVAVADNLSIEDDDSDCEIVKVIRTPKKRASSVASIHDENDADGEDSEEEPKDRKKALVSNRAAPVRLQQYSSNRTPAKADPVKPSPAKHVPAKPDPAKPDPAKPDFTNTPAPGITRDGPMADLAYGILPEYLAALAGNVEGRDVSVTVAPVA